MINLNHEFIRVSTFEYGKTQNIECKLGRQMFLLDVNKDNACTRLDFYKMVGTDRKSFSKYSAGAENASVTVKNDAVLDRHFFENIKKIAEAQMIVTRNNDKLYYL